MDTVALLSSGYKNYPSEGHSGDIMCKSVKSYVIKLWHHCLVDWKVNLSEDITMMNPICSGDVNLCQGSTPSLTSTASPLK